MHVCWNENVISYNLTKITRIFSAYKIDRKIRISSLGPDKQHSYIKKTEHLVIMCALIGHLYLKGFIFSLRLTKNCRKVSRPPDRTSGGSRGGARGARCLPPFLNHNVPLWLLMNNIVRKRARLLVYHHIIKSGEIDKGPETEPPFIMLMLFA